jgi:hypothetical protein
VPNAANPESSRIRPQQPVIGTSARLLGAIPQQHGDLILLKFRDVRHGSVASPVVNFRVPSGSHNDPIGSGKGPRQGLGQRDRRHAVVRGRSDALLVDRRSAAPPWSDAAYPSWIQAIQARPVSSLCSSATRAFCRFHARQSERWHVGSAFRSIGCCAGRKATATAEPWGVCTPEVLHAKFHADQPLAVDTSWVEIDGQRLELTQPEGPDDVRIDPTPVPDPARGHLWLRVAEHVPPPVYVNTPLEPTIEALVAAGTLTWDDPDVQDALEVVSATDLLDPLAIFRAKHAPATRADPPPQRVREPWASLLADRNRGNGPNRLVIIGATTPTFDGVTIQFAALDSTPESFTLDVRIHDATASRPGDLHYNHPQVTWWAVENRGNDYLGHLGESWAYAHVSGFGFCQVAFLPPLDPSANWLDIVPTTATSRAVLRVPLP